MSGNKETIWCPIAKTLCDEGHLQFWSEQYGDMYCSLYLDRCKLLGALDGLEKIGLASVLNDGEYHPWAISIRSR